MNKIASSAKFQELLKKFGASKTTSKDPKEQKKREENFETDVPLSVRKSSRDVKQPRRFDASPMTQAKSKQGGGTPIVRQANRAKENVSPPLRGPGRPKPIHREPNDPTSRPPKNDGRKLAESARSKSDRGKPADRRDVERRNYQVKQIERQELSDESDEEFLDSVSAQQSPPRGGASSRVASRNVVQGSPSRPWNDSRLPIRDPRLQNASRNNHSTMRQFCRPDLPSSRHDPHASTYHQPETSMRPPMQSRDISMRQPLQSREHSIRQSMQTREATVRPPLQSRDASMRHNFIELNASHLGQQPFVKLSDITKSREYTQRWEDGFLRPQTPPEVQDLVVIEKAKLQESINKMINSHHFTALECTYTLNAIQDNLISKMEKFCRKRQRTESILRNTRSETMQVQEGSRLDHDRVDAWLDGVGPGNQNSTRLMGKRQTHLDSTSVPKRRRLDTKYEYSRYDN